MNFNNIVSCYFYVQQVLCVLPITLNFQTFKIKYRKFAHLYSIVFVTSLVLIDVFIQGFFRQTNNVALNINIQMLTHLQAYYLVIMCILWSTHKSKETILMFQKLRIIFRKLKSLKIQTKFSKLFKALIIYSVITEFILINVHYIFYFVQNEINWITFLFITAISVVKYIIGSAFLIQVNVIFLMIRSISTMFNKILKNKMFDLKKLEKNNKWSKLKFDCEMSDFIDELSEIYRILGDVIRLASKTFGVLILIIASYVFQIIVIQFFQSYLFFTKFLKTGDSLDIVAILSMLASPTVRLLIFSLTLSYGEKSFEKVQFYDDLNCNFSFLFIYRQRELVKYFTKLTRIKWIFDLREVFVILFMTFYLYEEIIIIRFIISD